METSPRIYERKSSHKSNAVAPKRQRGRERVARILDTAGLLFAEKGVDGTTMTEIAARSGTAIGSLYRFFPTRESLANTLIERFMAQRLALLDMLHDAVAPGAYDEAAEALLNAWLEEREKLDFVMLSLAARPDAERYSAQWRSQFLERVVRILEAVMPACIETATARGLVLLYVLKLAPQLALVEEPEPVLRELHRVVLGLVSGAAEGSTPS